MYINAKWSLFKNHENQIPPTAEVGRTVWEHY